MEYVKAVLVVILCVILLIGSPIMIISYIVSAPLYLQICFIIWIIVIVMSFILSEKILTSIWISVFATGIFGLMLSSWYGEDVLHGDYYDGGLGDTIGIFCCTFAAAVSICISAYMLKQWLKMKHDLKISKANAKLKVEIDDLKINIEELKQELKHRQSVIKVLGLIDLCDVDISKIKNDPNISDINGIINAIKEKDNKIEKLQAEINNNDNRRFK